MYQSFQALANDARGLTNDNRRRPGNGSLRSECRRLLKDLLARIDERLRLETAPGGLPEITHGEERAARTVINVMKVAVEEYDAENAPPPINLSDLTPDTLKSLFNS